MYEVGLEPTSSCARGQVRAAYSRRALDPQVLQSFGNQLPCSERGLTGVRDARRPGYAHSEEEQHRRQLVRAVSCALRQPQLAAEALVQGVEAHAVTVRSRVARIQPQLLQYSYPLILLVLYSLLPFKRTSHAKQRALVPPSAGRRQVESADLGGAVCAVAVGRGGNGRGRLPVVADAPGVERGPVVQEALLGEVLPR
eukprot:scaffold127132_cov63-Phaeocystis_antarctica.AAC.2